MQKQNKTKKQTEKSSINDKKKNETNKNTKGVKQISKGKHKNENERKKKYSLK